MKKETRSNLLPFKITYPIVFGLIAIIDIIVAALIYNRWANLTFIQTLHFGMEIPPSAPPGIVLFSLFMMALYALWYYLIVYSPIFMLIFIFYDITKYLVFLRFGDQTTERALNLASGSSGTYAFRLHYFLTMFPMIAFTELYQIMMRAPGLSNPPGEAQYLLFTARFTPIFLIHILTLLLGPRVLKYTADLNNKRLRTKLIVFSIIWPIVFLIIFLFDSIVIFAISLVAIPP